MQDQAAKSARTRILEAAADLFYREGIRAVGVDAVIAHSGVAKMSLYRNFAGKDELVAAFLEHRDQLYWEWWDKMLARHPCDPRAQIRAIFEAVGKRTAHPDYRGCPFINTAVEFPDGGHPGRVVALTNKQELRARLRALGSTTMSLPSKPCTRRRYWTKRSPAGPAPRISAARTGRSPRRS